MPDADFTGYAGQMVMGTMPEFHVRLYEAGQGKDCLDAWPGYGIARHARRLAWGPDESCAALQLSVAILQDYMRRNRVDLDHGDQEAAVVMTYRRFAHLMVEGLGPSWELADVDIRSALQAIAAEMDVWRDMGRRLAAAKSRAR